MRFRTCFAAFLVLATAGWTAAETWERFRGPDGSGIARNQNLPVHLDVAKNLVWKAPIPGLGNSSPVVWNEYLFVQSSSVDGGERFLICLDSQTGKTRWVKKTPGAKAAMHAKNTLASATPATDGSAVYASTWNGKDLLLAAYSMKGEPIWEKDLGEFKSQHGPGASPVLYRDKVFFAFDMDGKAVMYAFDKATGKQVWSDRREAHRACYTLPQIIEKGANGTELIVTSTTAITSYNPETGSHNWDWKWNWGAGPKAEPLRTIAGSIRVDDMLYAFSGTASGRLAVGLKLPTASGAAPTQAWENRKDFPYVPSPIADGGRLYFANDKGFAGCFDAKTGAQIYLQRVPSATFTASPVLVDGKFYAASEEGDVFVYPAGPKFEILATNRIGERFRATPAVADGRIFLRGSETLFCFGKK